MTRFARAKGSKASNERLPEPSTSWSEMKHEMLNKNKEQEDKKQREKVMEQRQANYQAFLQEKEKEEDNKISWADFPKAQQTLDHQTSLNTANKRKFKSDDKKNQSKFMETNFENKKVINMDSFNQQNEDLDCEDSNDEFSALKLKIDKALSSQNADDSDSDAPPEEASIKDKPEDIVIKKVKKPRQKLQILINPKGKSIYGHDKVNNNVHKKAHEIETKEGNVKNENLSDKDKRKIEKKQERYKKQLEKKKLQIKENKLRKDERTDEVKTYSDLNNHVLESGPLSINSSEIDAKKLLKRLERRKKQKEKKLQKKKEAGLSVTLEDKKKDEVLTEKDLANIQKKKERRARQAEKRKKFREAKELAAENATTEKGNEQPINENNSLNCDKNGSNINKNVNRNNTFPDKFINNDGNLDFMERKPYQKTVINQKPVTNQKVKKAKLKDIKDIQKNKSRPEKMFINGKTVEIDYVEGFPVKKEDADRLKKLRKEMISKGLPRSEINIALKLERRRAEKALTREKKNVCFNCRKSGHNLSECPELEKDQVAQTSGTGICFKCGSTEHTHFECKVVRGMDYKFATCFICKEQGHISRQCPDNQRGLYPKGGSCKVCGDVTHLKKDCPKFQTQQAQLQDNLSIETMDSRNPDDLGSKWEHKTNSGPVKKLNKIKF